MNSSYIRMYSPDGKASKIIPALDVDGWLTIRGWLLQPPETKSSEVAKVKTVKKTTRKRKPVEPAIALAEEVEDAGTSIQISEDDAL